MERAAGRAAPDAEGVDVVVVGGAYTDFVARGPRLPGPGEDVRGDAFLQLPGGKGLNQAVAAARLGARVAFIGCIGSDERGNALAASLTEEGIDASYLFRSSSVDTGAALIHVDATAHKQILVAPGANACLTAQDVAAAASPLKRSRILMVQLEVPLEAVEAGVKLAAEAGVKVLLDPAPPRNVSDELLAMVDVLRPDAKEAEALTGIAVRDRASAQRAAEHLLERGVRLVAVQAGDEGNLLAWQNGSYFVPLLQLDHRVDATGAGDAFAAALAVSLVEGRPRESAAWFANAAAALTTTVLGAYPALPRRDAVDKLMAEHADTSGLRMLG